MNKVATEPAIAIFDICKLDFHFWYWVILSYIYPPPKNGTVTLDDDWEPDWGVGGFFRRPPKVAGPSLCAAVCKCPHCAVIDGVACTLRTPQSFDICVFLGTVFSLLQAQRHQVMVRWSALGCL